MGTIVLMMSFVMFKMLKVKLSLPMPRRHTGEQRYDEQIDYVVIILGWCKLTGSINAGIHVGTSLLAMKIMKLGQNVCN
jgi:hypothetical protein